MTTASCVCAVSITREDGLPWDPTAQSSSNGGQAEAQRQIRWIYPVRGVPQSSLGHETPLTIECEVPTN